MHKPNLCKQYKQNTCLPTHQSGSHVVPILLTVYLFQPSTGGTVQMKEKDQTKSKPMTACFACSLMLPRGRQITKKRSKDRTARDHSATIPVKQQMKELLAIITITRTATFLFHSQFSSFFQISSKCFLLFSYYIHKKKSCLCFDKVPQLPLCTSVRWGYRCSNCYSESGVCTEPHLNGLKKDHFNYSNKSLSQFG